MSCRIHLQILGDADLDKNDFNPCSAPLRRCQRPSHPSYVAHQQPLLTTDAHFCEYPQFK